MNAQAGYWTMTTFTSQFSIPKYLFRYRINFILLCLNGNEYTTLFMELVKLLIEGPRHDVNIYRRKSIDSLKSIDSPFISPSE